MELALVLGVVLLVLGAIFAFKILITVGIVLLVIAGVIFLVTALPARRR